MLDLRFPNDKSPEIFAVAASTGAICLFAINVQEAEPIRQVKTIELVDPTVLVLSLAWCPKRVSASTIAASLSDGRIVIFDHQSVQNSMRTVRSHSLEAWTLAWSTCASGPGNPQLYSGGDDSAIFRHDLESNQLKIVGSSMNIGQAEYSPLSRDTRTHTAGVTAIMPLYFPKGASTEYLLTGSYDEYVRVLAVETLPNSKEFEVLAEKGLHGGVWQLLGIETGEKPDGCYFATVLASCMHAGAKILKIHRSREGEWTIQVAARFEDHESMNYASDGWFDYDGFSTTFTVASTSFYDKKLCIWNWRTEDTWY